MKERDGVDLGGSGSGEELGEAGGKGTVVRIYCIKTIFDKKYNFYFVYVVHACIFVCMYVCEYTGPH